ncbi:hypothetical protein NM208_g13069 [Fusarium decemcellulare]|uniref:Uncharacterized protein n=1 Tax=Fusarium decemcellulare TaxID=57161 RepID=A0ACC1RME7_9HYPO|nr:hypothetical protein NM208_g13069 [Fusarium decemcellulare]
MLGSLETGLRSRPGAREGSGYRRDCSSRDHLGVKTNRWSTSANPNSIAATVASVMGFVVGVGYLGEMPFWDSGNASVDRWRFVSRSTSAIYGGDEGPDGPFALPDNHALETSVLPMYTLREKPAHDNLTPYSTTKDLYGGAATFTPGFKPTLPITSVPLAHRRHSAYRKSLACWLGMEDTRQLPLLRTEPQFVNATQVFDEAKCRNVLVRYCAHIPRNYQYRDGIRLVFLVLRDHLGDEYLGLAGGVLYEMIEVDCQHSDDPGAAFQRWRHDHMNRHTDLELPHVPHLTTVTSTITPTVTLTRWRKDHPQRYRTRLSDYSPPRPQSSMYMSAIRTRKDWAIEYTMHVSSQSEGTRPFRQINAREFHEMQWNTMASHTGRLVDEKSVDLEELQRAGDLNKPTEKVQSITNRLSLGSKLMERNGKITKMILKFRGLRLHEGPPGQVSKERSKEHPGGSTEDRPRSMFEQRYNFQVSDWEIPNANFARKFGLYTDSRPLPPFIRELPVAEDKAVDMAAGYGMRELVYSWKFQGPFTPQLWFSHTVQSSPAKSSTKSKKKSTMATPKSTPRKNKSSASRSEAPYSWALSGEDGSSVDSPTFSELMPGHQQYLSQDVYSGSLAERRQRLPPSPLQLDTRRRQATVARPADMEDIPDAVSPLSQGMYGHARVTEDDVSSFYSRDLQYSAHPSPLELRHSAHDRSQSKVNGAVVDAYHEWIHAHDPSMIRESVSHPEPLVNRPRRSKSSADGLRQSCPFEAQAPPIPQTLRTENTQHAPNTPLFSPLQLYFRGTDFPSVKKGEKTMIGDNGWLERTDKNVDLTKKAPQKKVGILDSIKKIAKDMTELHHSSRRPQPVAKARRPTSQIAISLDSREQSLLYCELEFNLSTALNDYTTIQLDKGRLVPDKLKKVADLWQNKGRPKVVGFRYDLETQLELIHLHADDFRFYGRRQADPIEIAALLHTMKINARAMSIRTFCQPDSVIAKQLVDAQSLFKMLGVSDAQQIALAEIAQFFKVIVERELDYRDRREHEASRGRPSHGRGDSRWTMHSER